MERIRRPSQHSSQALARTWAGLSLLLLGCSGAEDPTGAGEVSSWPEGTVLVCAGDPIRADEVDLIAEALKPLGPKFTEPHLRRLALTNVRLPLAAGRTQAGKNRRDQALGAAEASFRSLAEVPPGAGSDPGILTEGAQDVLGVPLWVLIQGLESTVWTGPSELPGQFVVVKLVERDENAQAQREQFTVRVLAFPYVDDPPSLAGEALKSTLVVVDEAWGPLVPGFWRHQMGTAGDSRD